MSKGIPRAMCAANLFLPNGNKSKQAFKIDVVLQLLLCPIFGHWPNIINADQPVVST